MKRRLLTRVLTNKVLRMASKKPSLYLRCADRYLCHYCVVCKLCIIIFFKILIQKCVQGQARACKNMCVFLVLAFLTLSNNDPETEKAIHLISLINKCWQDGFLIVLLVKVHIFWEGHKNLRNLHQIFVLSYVLPVK